MSENDKMKNDLRNLMLYSYIDKCGLSPAEIIEAITRYKALKKVGVATRPEATEMTQLEMPLDS